MSLYCTLLTNIGFDLNKNYKIYHFLSSLLVFLLGFTCTLVFSVYFQKGSQIVKEVCIIY